MPPKKKPKLIRGQGLLTAFSRPVSGTPAVSPTDPQETPAEQSSDSSEVGTRNERPERESDEETSGSSVPAQDSEEVKSQPVPVRSFQKQWLVLHPWLRYDGQAMYCATCVNAGCRNVFTTGCRNFKTSSLNDHIGGRDHKNTVNVPKDQENQAKMEEIVLCEKSKGMIVRIKVMNWLVKEGLPICKFTPMLKLLSDLNTPDIKLTEEEATAATDSDEEDSKRDGKTARKPNDYKSRWTAIELLSAMSDVAEEEVKEKLQASPFVTVLTDESTDISQKKRLVISAQITDPATAKPTTHFVTNVTIAAGTGRAITAELLQQMKSRGIMADKIMGLGSDGASVMTGKKEGVAGLLKRENPHLLNVHCVAHRFNLCTSQAADNIKYMNDYQKVLCDLFYYFKASSTRCSKLEAVQEILDSPQLKVKEVHGVRWLSFFQALETVYRILEPLITYLDDQAKQTDPKAAGLRSKIATEKFVSMTYILMDVIPIIGKLNLFFQKENVDVALIQVKVDHCISDLEKLLEEDGFHQQKLNKDLDTDAHIYNGANGQYPVTGCPADQITSTKTQFIQQLIQNIQSRFQEDCDLLAAFGVLGMRPLSVLSKAELKTWGNKDIQRLTDHFGEEQVHEYMEDKVKMQAKSKPILCAMSAQAEWVELKETVLAEQYPRDNIVSLWEMIAINHQKHFPNMMKLAHLALSSPVHTAGCERVFSQQNLTLTKLRNRLTGEHQDMLLRVKLHDGNIDPLRALRAWQKAKPRKV